MKESFNESIYERMTKNLFTLIVSLPFLIDEPFAEKLTDFHDGFQDGRRGAGHHFRHILGHAVGEELEGSTHFSVLMVEPLDLLRGTQREGRKWGEG